MFFPLLSEIEYNVVPVTGCLYKISSDTFQQMNLYVSIYPKMKKIIIQQSFHPII